VKLGGKILLALFYFLNTHIKRWLNLNNQGNANQHLNEISPYSCQIGLYEKDKKLQVFTRMWRKRNPRELLAGMYLEFPLMQKFSCRFIPLAKTNCWI